MNCEECLGQRRVLMVQSYPGRLDEPCKFTFREPISNYRTHRLFWQECRHCHGDGYEDDIDTIRRNIAELKEALEEKWGKVEL